MLLLQNTFPYKNKIIHLDYIYKKVVYMICAWYIRVLLAIIIINILVNQ